MSVESKKHLNLKQTTSYPGKLRKRQLTAEGQTYERFQIKSDWVSA